MTSRTQPPSDRDTEAAALGHVRDHRRRSSGLPKYYTIKAVAEAIDVSTRTVRRWVANGDLIVHRVDGVVRIGERDVRAFLALHREG
jgi:excisionase family DNA binding protein